MENGGNIASRLARRILLAIGRGRVATSNDSGVVQLVQTKFNDLETIDNMPRVAEFGFTSRPPNGSDVLAVFIGGDRSNGVIVGTNHQGSRPTGLAIGETKLYSLIGQYVYLSTAGIVIEAAGLPVTVNDASSVVVNSQTTVKVVAPTNIEFDTPLLKVTGDVLDNSGSNTHTMAQMRSIYNAHTHPVRGVQTGSSQVTSDVPSQPE
ncbi:TPA: phage baseplate assembly protein V [Burkholderia contaminans]|uniref:phage baseplate assembly protein V n=1 Tax=Burkholderia contaminans TaxID=488447 RepID=UPI000D004512|nr:phage baseplate assembly protein V [Burkholderia contaminans]HDR9065473.1 phage baseplate assembly protein [Burkholderia vietnamiensis]MBM6427912.1 phage baseplate assembly protein [Burkholderia contaminans]MCA7876743.1 phage baseplate assembly protein V [Burkholderia contaminans]MDN8024234.1 phage baseplate assembly protein V [Burkholderia contaminans]PRG14360.1 baseplate assembly protein [Burkholderia contaminans]